jgi:hypothetical protein
VKADLERELGGLVLECSACGRTVHWIAGLAATPGIGLTASPRPTENLPSSPTRHRSGAQVGEFAILGRECRDDT